MVYSSAYRRAYKEPSWDDYSKKEFFSKLQYRSDRRSVEHRHQPWNWDSGSDDEDVEEIHADDGSYEGGRRLRSRKERPMDDRIPKQAWGEGKEEIRQRDNIVDQVAPVKLSYGEEGEKRQKQQPHSLIDNVKQTKRGQAVKNDENHAVPDKTLVLPEKLDSNRERGENYKQSHLVRDKSSLKKQDQLSNVDMQNYRSRSKSSRKKQKSGKVPFLTYGMANEGPVDMWKTHNVLASKPQVYPAALRAQKRRQQEIKKKAQLREEAAKKKETPGHFDAEIAFPKSWWLTEYQRNYCREEDVKRHFLR